MEMMEMMEMMETIEKVRTPTDGGKMMPATKRPRGIGGKGARPTPRLASKLAADGAPAH